MSTYSKHIVEVETVFKKRGNKNIEQTTTTIEKLGRGLNKTTTSATKFDDRGRGVTTTTERMTRGFERFNMEQLGVMFGGMALNRAMNTLNATSREWLGIGELTSTMMGITMLDANIDLLEYGVLPLFDALTNLPPEAQKAIGYLSMGLEALGMTMMVGGQLMLGLDSTVTLLQKLGDGSAVAGLSTVSNKLKEMGRYAAIGVTLYMAGKDLAEGEITAAIGDVMMASGFYWKNGWLLGAGILLKITGDADAQAALAKVMILLADTIYRFGEWTSDTLKKALTLNWDEVDTTFFSDFMSVYKETAEELNAEGKLHSDYLQNAFSGMGESAISYKKKLDEISNTYEEDSPEWISSVEDLTDEYENLISFIDKAITRTTELSKAYEDPDYSIGKMIDEKFSGGGDESRLGQDLTPFAVGGTVRNTGAYYLHEGEKVIPKTGTNSGINVTATYHVNVSDKREFETMLRKNNQQLTSEVRRIVRV